MTATYTFDAFPASTLRLPQRRQLRGYWGKQGPELLDHRLTLHGAEQQIAFGPTPTGAFVRLLASSTEEEHAGNCGVDHPGRTPRLAGRNRRER